MRTIAHDTHSGPGLLRLRLPAGAVTVVANPATERASVTLIPQHAGDQDARDAIERTQAWQSGDLIDITVPEPVAVRTTERVMLGHQADGAAATATLAAPSGVAGGGVLATVVVPSGQRVEIDSGSAGVIATGPLARLRVDTGSGDLRLDRAEDADLTTGSGSIVLHSAVSVRARTGSGDVCVDRMRTGVVRVGSGDITVLAASGDVSVDTGCGSVRAHLESPAPVRATTGCGDIRITADPGIRIDRSGLSTGFGAIHAD